MSIRATTDAVLGYLVCGFLILAACEAAYDGKWLVERDWHPEAILLFGMIAWCAGCVVSRLSRPLLEDRLVDGWLKSPEEVLLADTLRGTRTWKRFLFPAYYIPLPEETRQRILDTAERDGFYVPGRNLFVDALAFVEQNAPIRRRLELYRWLGSICRSLCVGLVAVAAILVTGIIWHGVSARWGQSDLRKLGYCLLSLWEAAGMLYRYLRFRRQYVLGVLTGYAELRAPHGQ